MVATLLKLRFRLLANTLSREVWRLVFTIIGALYALGVIAMLGVGAFFLGFAGVDLSAPAVAAGVVLTVLWVVVPLLAYGVDDTLDPARFALFTTPTPAFGAGLILAGAVTIPGLLTLGGLLAMTLAWVSSPAAIPAWIIAAVLGFAICLTLARVCTTAAATQLRSRRGRDVAAGLGMVLILGAALLPSAMDGIDLQGIWDASGPVLAVLAWTPLGAPWAIPGAVAAGSFGLGAAYLVVSLAWLAAILYLWVRLLGPAMTMPAEASAATRKGKGTFALPQRLHETFRLPLPSAAVAARALRYWRSDPRYFTQALTVILIGPVLAFVLFLTPELSLQLMLAMPVFTAFFAGWALHNDTGYDSTAIWMHIASGARGRDDRLGRAFAFLTWALPAVLAMTTLVLALSGNWQYGPALFGAVLGIFGGGLGFSLAVSGFVVYPVQPPGTSPFSTTGMGAFGFTLLVQSVAAIATFGLAIPAMVTAALGVFLAPGWGYVSLAVGLLTAIASVWAGIVLGGKFLDQRAPNHLLAIRGWTGH